MALIVSILLPLRLAMLLLGLRQRANTGWKRMVANVVWIAIALSFVIVFTSCVAKLSASRSDAHAADMGCLNARV